MGRHERAVGGEDAETVASGTRAAALGGAYVSLADGAEGASVVVVAVEPPVVVVVVGVVVEVTGVVVRVVVVVVDEVSRMTQFPSLFTK